MTPLHYICSFVLSKDGADDAPLRCRIKWDSSRSIVSLNVGYRVNPARWDAKMQRCHINSFHGRRRTPAAIINREIQRFCDAADAVFARYAREDVWPAPEQVRSDLRVELGIEEHKDVSVASAYREFLQDGIVRSSWGKSTPVKFAALWNHMERWEPQLSWSSFTTAGLTGFVASLRREGLRNSTIDKQMGFIKWFLKWAAEHKYLECMDYQSFKLKQKQTQKRIIYLDWDELMKVWEYEPGPGRRTYELTRDIFCFCAFTSLRYSDAQALRWADVGRDNIRITTQKTQDSLDIRLNKWSAEILGRYVDVPVEDDFVFPRIPNQLMNRILKTVCKECGIDTPIRITYYKGNERIDEVHPKYELVGTHCARRTFVCTALSLGISPSVVMTWTGHACYEDMRPYIDIADSTKASAMALFDDINRTPETL